MWLWCSPGLAELLGYKPEQLLGNTADKLLPTGFEYNQQIGEQFLAQGVIRRFMPRETKGGKKFGAWINYQLLRDGWMVAIIEPLGQ